MAQGTSSDTSRAAKAVARALAVVVVCATATGALTAPAAVVDGAGTPPSAGQADQAGRATAPPAGPATVPLAAPLTVPLAGARVPALASDGLTESSHSRYAYDGDSRTVRATVRTTIRNIKPDQGLRYFFWNAYGIPVPKGAQKVSATSGGQPLTVRFDSTEDEFTNWATVSFSNLRYGQSRIIDWSYTIPGDPIRSKSYTRVGKGYATFAAQSIGDPDSVSMEIVAPSVMEFTSMAGDFTEKRVSGKATWSTRTATDEYGIWSLVSLRNPDQADTTTVEVAGEDLTLLSFPGDKKWTTFVEERLTEGLPIVEEITGQEWPGGLREIREDATPDIAGFAWYDGARREIVIGEDLDEQLFYHELTHTWVNGSTLDGRWLVEGVTEAIARRVVEQTGGKPDRKTVARDADAALALSTWPEFSQDFRDVDRATEDYAYAAAPATIEKLVAGLDDEEFADLVSALLNGESSYGEPGDSRVWGDVDWRRLLDLLEGYDGVEDAQQTLATWVLTDQEKKEFPPRAEARKQYFALDEADGEWLPPQGFRVQMARWQFDRAAETREAIGDDTPAAALRVQEAAAAGGFPAPSQVRKAYEDAPNGLTYPRLAEMMLRAADVTEQVSEVVRRTGADRDPFTELGETLLLADTATDDAVRHLDAGRLDEAAEAAERASQLANLALWAGILLVLLVLGAGLLVVWLVVRGRRRRRAARALAAQDTPGWSYRPEQPAPASPHPAPVPGPPGTHGAAETWGPAGTQEPGARSPQPSGSRAQLPPPLPLPPPTDPWHSMPESGDQER